jgi:NAD(P)H-nitrite reductase large subunit
MAKKIDITKEQLLKAIEGSQGLVTKIQKKLEAARGEKICWDTVNKLINKYEETQAAVKAEKEAMLDLAENNIFRDMANGDVGTSKWYLKMKGKERGYEEVPTIQVTNDDPLKIDISGEPMSAEDLAGSADIEVTGGDKE